MRKEKQNKEVLGKNFKEKGIPEVYTMQKRLLDKEQKLIDRDKSFGE